MVPGWGFIPATATAGQGLGQNKGGENARQRR